MSDAPNRYDITLSVRRLGDSEPRIEFELGSVTMEKARAAIMLLLDEEPEAPRTPGEGR